MNTTVFRRIFRSKNWKQQLVNNSSIIALLIIFVWIALVTPGFFTTRNMINVLNQSAALGFMVIGITAVFITGGIDLSIPSVMALSGILAAKAMQNEAGIMTAVVISLSVGLFLGLINGYAIGYLRMIPFVVTLSIQIIGMGLCVWLTSKVSIPISNEVYLDLFNGKVGIIPVSVLYLAFMTFVVTILSKKTIWGRWLYATGINIKTATVSGIPIRMVLLGAYAWSGLFAGMAALLVTSRLASASSTMGQEGVVLNVVSSAVVGGVSFQGGFGSPLGAVLGALIITLISNSMNMMQISYYTTLIVKGIVIIAFVSLDSIRRRK